MKIERNEEFYELSNIIDNCESSYCDYVAEELMEAGYRKANYVSKETAKEILKELYPYIGHWLTFKALKEKYGVEVDE